jgi:hypothetical protein
MDSSTIDSQQMGAAEANSNGYRAFATPSVTAGRGRVRRVVQQRCRQRH